MENQQQLSIPSDLSILPVNKTTVFYSPIEGGKDVLVRTGTIPTGNCFYHSLLHAYSRDYVSMDDKERKKIVSKLRRSLPGQVNHHKWKKMSSSITAKISFQNNVISLLKDFYRYIQKGKKGRTNNIHQVIRNVIKKDDDDEWYKIILEMVPITQFENEILPTVYDRSPKSSISDCQREISSETKRYYKKIFESMKNSIESKRKHTCVKKLLHMINSITDEADKMAYKEYKYNIKNTSITVDYHTIKAISDRFDRDIYFINSKTRMPYNNGGKDLLKNRKSIIIMWTGDLHYEVIGRLLPGNRVQREFSKNDPLIKKIYTFLYKPEKVVKKYPNLIPYLPEKYRNKNNNSSSSREYNSSYDEENSDNYSSSRNSGNMSDESTQQYSNNILDSSSSEERWNHSPSSSPPKRRTRKKEKYSHKY